MLSLSHRASWLAGTIPDLPTPFDEGGAIDWDALVNICGRQIEAGISAIVVGETAGEFSTLAPEEHDRIVRAAVAAVGGRAKIISGAGSNSTSQAIELAKRAEAAGADAILSVVPYYNKPMQAGMLAHFRGVAAATRLPVILHDIPARTLRELSDETIVELAKSENIVGLLDGTGDMARCLRLRCSLGFDFRLLSGDDMTALAYLASGGDGCISATASVAPELFQAIDASCHQGRLQSARYLHKRIAPLAACLAKEGPAGLKYALCMLGFMRPGTRLPIVELAEPAKAEVERALLELIDEPLLGPASRVQKIAGMGSRRAGSL